MTETVAATGHRTIAASLAVISEAKARISPNS